MGYPIAYNTYRRGTGRFGFDLPGDGVEFDLFRNWAHGAFIAPSTTGSSQITGAGNGTYLYNITTGVVVVGGKILAVGAVNQACEAAGNIMIATFAKVYAIVAYVTAANIAAIKVVPGVAALAANAVPPTLAMIEAVIPAANDWYVLGTMTISRTADTTVTEAASNLYRPLGTPITVQTE